MTDAPISLSKRGCMGVLYYPAHAGAGVETMTAKKFAEKIAAVFEELDADMVSNIPVNLGDEGVVRSELEARGLKVEVLPTFVDVERTKLARFLLTVTRR